MTQNLPTRGYHKYNLNDSRLTMDESTASAREATGGDFVLDLDDDLPAQEEELDMTEVLPRRPTLAGSSVLLASYFHGGRGAI